MTGWRFVLDEAARREMEAARIASDERTRLTLSKFRRVQDILPGFEAHAYLDTTMEMDGLTARVRVYDPKRRPTGDEGGFGIEGR